MNSGITVEGLVAFVLACSMIGVGFGIMFNSIAPIFIITGIGLFLAMLQVYFCGGFKPSKKDMIARSIQHRLDNL